MVQYDIIQAREGYINKLTVDPARAGTAASPGLNFGDGDTGFYESATNQLSVSLAGTIVGAYHLQGVTGGSIASGQGVLSINTATATIPGLTFLNDANTGIGTAGADILSLIAGGIEAERFTEVSNKVIKDVQASVGLTADAGSAQGDGIILSSYNVYDTVETAGDAATLPASFNPGQIIFIKNGDAANSMDVFPASGDDLGQGANTQEALAAGDFAVYIGTSGDAVWEKLMGGTT